jgi:hypothetical protein
VAIISTGDLPDALQSADMIDLMVDGANARAARVAPCLVSTDPAPTADQLAEARLVLVGAVKRWSEAGSGAISQQSAGPFAMALDTRQRGGFGLWPSEINALQDICATGGDTSATAFSIRPGASSGNHMPWCALAFGATYCSCGADLTNGEYPLYEGGVLTGDEY